MRQGWFPTVRDLGDLAGYWRGCGREWSVTELATEAEDCALSGPLLALCRILEEMEVIPAGDAGLTALRHALGAAACTEGKRLSEWFFERLENPDLGGNQMLDLFMLLTDPRALLRLLRDRLVERRRTAAEPWRRRLEELRALRGESDTRRACRLLASLAELDGRQMRSLWGVVRAKRRAFAPHRNAHRHER